MDIFKTLGALALNAGIAGMEAYVLSHVANKKDILKYYTYLSNLIALLSSAVFVVFTCLNLLSGDPAPIWLKGIRFTATYMLVTTLFVFSFVLLPWDKSGNTMRKSDFSGDFSPKTANLLLHYLCPLISAFSFLLLERQPVLADSQWTFYGAIPTIIYWIVYLILTAANLWKDPYGLSDTKSESKSVSGALLGLLIPMMSMGLDYQIGRAHV